MNQPRRRQFILATGALLAVPRFAGAQSPGRIAKIGYLGNSTLALESGFVGALVRGMQSQGYAEGRNYAITYLWAEGKNERLPELAAEFVRLKMDVIVTAGTPGTLAAKRATATVPIVMVAVGDAVGAGLVASLSNPGGNLTGLATLANELEGKRLELLKEMKPDTSRVAVLMNPGNPFTPIAWRGMQEGAKKLRLTLLPTEVASPEQLEPAFSSMKSARADALVVIADRFLLSHRTKIAEMALKAKLPGMFPFEDFVREGGLMAYAPNYPEMYQRAATFVDRILKGANPSGIPVELPTVFELSINLKTAKALGIAIAPAVRMRADRVIE